jgi:hypothetical protein
MGFTGNVETDSNANVLHSLTIVHGSPLTVI